ncbi:energy-coupling factor transport system permease protein [Weissella uvarum]|uniref:energy-coupling factor transporter transmembrane component T n=1 Tax=Weissella uvarum TaxID=1479233 RepID=UPI00195FCE11|nr:energy-coupling factor transporter transmembrane component T [Weissella uvarum]MBM7617161.1 energy-coupling factor transport system permease protein [Weissella uvarum]MCM0595457.1 energy-coupling factor transporter transmembrane protein EcfT [Weissella uvarum]
MQINPSVLIIILLGIGIPMAFVQSIPVNIVVCMIALIYLAYRRASIKTITLVGLITLPLALGTGWSFIAFGTGDVWHQAWLQVTRLFAYVLLGMTLTLTTHVKDILFSCVLHLHLSPTFAYGLLAAFNLLPRIQRQVKIIRYSANLRGLTYHLWQPQLYFKAILSALQWSNDLAQGMSSHGFSEGFPRTMTYTDTLPKWQWLLAVVLIITYSYFGFF